MNNNMLLQARAQWMGQLAVERLTGKGNPEWIKRHLVRLDEMIKERGLNAESTNPEET